MIVFGAFDGLHPGHLNFFKQAKKHGDYLIVSVGTDKNVAKFKGRLPLFSESERVELVKNLKIIDETILGAEKDFYKQIKQYAPDVLCLGYDQWASVEDVKKNLLVVGLAKIKVVRLAPHKENRAKSTQMKKRSVDF